MPVRYYFWTPRAEAKVAEHGVEKHEAEQVLEHPERDEPSASDPDHMWAAGYTAAGRWIVVAYEPLDDLWVAPITAYEPAEE